jgi:1-acyl-sn-glycerol-3-phosphate acyltransferase
VKRFIELSVFWIRLILTLVWMVISSFITVFLAVFQWKNIENNYRYARFYGPLARLIMNIRVVVEGEEFLEPEGPAVFIGNHQSGLDVMSLSRVCPRGAVIIGKKELRKIPGFGLIFEAFGNVLIDRKNRADALGGLRKAVEMMHEKKFSVLIFPEGTRNGGGVGLLPFKKGAFYMASEAKVPLIPIVCSSIERLVSFKHRYARSGTLVIRVLPPIQPSEFAGMGIDALMSLAHERMLKALHEVNTQAESLDRA